MLREKLEKDLSYYMHLIGTIYEPEPYAHQALGYVFSTSSILKATHVVVPINVYNNLIKAKNKLKEIENG